MEINQLANVLENMNECSYRFDGTFCDNDGNEWSTADVRGAVVDMTERIGKMLLLLDALDKLPVFE
jgi:hypothetical protein